MSISAHLQRASLSNVTFCAVITKELYANKYSWGYVWGKAVFKAVRALRMSPSIKKLQKDIKKLQVITSDDLLLKILKNISDNNLYYNVYITIHILHCILDKYNVKCG